LAVQTDDKKGRSRVGFDDLHRKPSCPVNVGKTLGYFAERESRGRGEVKILDGRLINWCALIAYPPASISPRSALV